MPRRKVLPSALLAWIEAQPPGSIMRPGTFKRIQTAALDRLIQKGVPTDEAVKRSTAQAGSAYWRAAAKKYFLATSAPGAAKPERRKRVKKNPVLAVMGNPHAKAGQIFSMNVHSIAYTHKVDRKDYRHEFGGSVHMRANRDGSITIYHPERRLWGDFR